MDQCMTYSFVCKQTISVKNCFLNKRLNQFAASRIISATGFVDGKCQDGDLETLSCKLLSHLVHIYMF